MEQLVRVIRANSDGTALVLHVRQSACSGDCHKCSGCGAAQQKLLLTAHNPIGAQPGQVVTVRSDSGTVLSAAAVLYLLPLLLFFVGYLIFQTLWQLGAAGGGLGFAAGLLLVILYDRLVIQKRNIIYTITGFGKEPPSPEEGDNDLD